MNKYSLSIILTLCILFSCGKSTVEKAEKQDVKSIQAEIKLKRADIKKIKSEIAALEESLVKLDPSFNRQKKVPVTTQAIETKSFSHFVEVQGNVSTLENPAMASSETGGRIVELKVKEGDYVKKGDLLAKVNLESIKKSIAQLDESLNLAQDIFERQENLWKQKIGSEVQYLQAKSQVESLKKNKESLEFELSKATVFAPASGYVDMVFLKPGEMSGPGTPILQILNTKRLKVVADVPEVYLGKVKRGEKVRLSYPALEETNEGKVSMIGRSINPANRTFSVEAIIDSKNELLKPNLLATMMIEDFSAENVIVVPDELILQDISGTNYVMVAEGNVAVKKPVSMGKNYKNETVITNGLDGTETLIIKGARQVADGDEIKILTE